MCLFLYQGCTPLQRSARIYDGFNVTVTGGAYVGDRDRRGEIPAALPYGQLEFRSGRAATKQRFGKSVGVIVPYYFLAAQLELYVEIPRKFLFNMGFGAQAGLSPSLFHITSIPVGKNDDVEFFVINRFVAYFAEEENDRWFRAYNISAGVAVNITSKITATIGYHHYFVPGSFEYLYDETSDFINTDIDILGLNITFHSATR